MFKPVIAGFSRSPFTMARNGALIDSKPVNLLAEVIKYQNQMLKKMTLKILSLVVHFKQENKVLILESWLLF